MVYKTLGKALLPDLLPELVRDLSDAQLHAIGHVIAEWGRMEHTLFVATASVFAEASGKKRRRDTGVLSMLMAAGMTPRILVGLLKGLFEFAQAAEADEFNKLADRILKCGKSRDIISHSAWRKGKKPDGLVALTVRAVGKIRLETPEFTPTEMESLATRIRSTRLDLIRFIRRLGFYTFDDTRTEQAPE